MGMNPDTNKMELLSRLDVAVHTDPMLPGTLVRPNGEPVPEHWSRYSTGEEVVLKGYRFRIGHISEGALLLEPIGAALVDPTA